MIRIYLAGPILGCDRGEANNWRTNMCHWLEGIGIRGISPLRCEPLIGDKYGVGYSTDLRFGTPTAIRAKNMLDVKTCDLTLANFPDELIEQLGPSLGTIMEVGWASAYEKPIIIVSTHPKITKHPVICSSTPWMLPDLDQAFDTIQGLFADYARPIRRE